MLYHDHMNRFFCIKSKLIAILDIVDVDHQFIEMSVPLMLFVFNSTYSFTTISEFLLHLQNLWFCK